MGIKDEIQNSTELEYGLSKWQVVHACHQSPTTNRFFDLKNFLCLSKLGIQKSNDRETRLDSLAKENVLQTFRPV